MSELLGVTEAQDRLLKYFSPVELEDLPLDKASGRILAAPVFAQVDLPPFSNSGMDGFAVHSSDLLSADPTQPVTLPVVTDIPAGKPPARNILPGEAARIMTGAAIPDGADAVVPVEETNFTYRQPGGHAPADVSIFHKPRPGDHIRPRGQDVRAGERVMDPGIRLRPQDIGLLSMLGVAQVTVYRRPRIAVFSTGDELLPVDQPLSLGKIHDSNSYTLIALIHQNGGEPVHLGIVPDQESQVESCLEQARTARVDLILSSAGVSVGAFDFVRSVVERKGKLEFWRVNMRPGKPLAFGSYAGIPFIGLPGNPVSAYVGFEVFVRIALLKLAGVQNWKRQTLRVRLAEPVDSDGRESYLRAVIEHTSPGPVARLTGHQGSGNLRSLVQANALLVIPSGVKFLPAGAEVDAWPMDRSMF